MYFVVSAARDFRLFSAVPLSTSNFRIFSCRFLSAEITAGKERLVYYLTSIRLQFIKLNSLLDICNKLWFNTKGTSQTECLKKVIVTWLI